MNITQEMRDWFEQRTATHIKYVQAAAANIAEAYPEFADLKARARVHDQSKYQQPEKEPYIWISWMYKHKNAGRAFKYPEGVEEETRKASQHHILTNRHHPEYHAGEAPLHPKDRDRATKPIEPAQMTDLDLAEMVADWAAMSRELGEEAPRSWYNQNVGRRWKFNPHQTQVINKLLKIFDNPPPPDSSNPSIEACRYRILAGVTSRLDNIMEALARRKFRYQRYKKDPNPDVLILDPHYNGDVLGFNLNYLRTMSKKDLEQMLKDIQKEDNSVVGVSSLKRFVQKMLGKGHYKVSSSVKVRRYQALIRKFPRLKPIIRRYKTKAIR